jgi:hypothetical protein
MYFEIVINKFCVLNFVKLFCLVLPLLNISEKVSMNLPGKTIGFVIHGQYSVRRKVRNLFATAQNFKSSDVSRSKFVCETSFAKQPQLESHSYLPEDLLISICVNRYYTVGTYRSGGGGACLTNE